MKEIIEKLVSKHTLNLAKAKTLEDYAKTENNFTKELLKAINYTRCCTQLKDKEETAFDLWLKNFKHVERDLYWYNKDTLYCVEAMRDIYNTEIKPKL